MFSIAIGPIYMFLYSPASLLLRQDSSSVLVLLGSALFLMCSLLSILRRGEIAFLQKNVALLLFPFLLFLSGVNYNQLTCYFNYKILAAILIFVCIVELGIRNKDTIEKGVKVYSIVMSFMAIIYGLALFTPYAQFSGDRYFMFGENPNSYSTRFVLGIISTIYTAPRLEKKFVRFFLYMAIPLCLLQVIVSGSRGNLVMILLITLVYLFYSKNINKGYVLMGLIIFFLLTGLVLYKLGDNVEITIFERLSRTINEKETGGRTNLFKYAFSIFLDNPIFGVGENGFVEIMKYDFNIEKDAHNLFLYILATSGIVGFILFCTTLFRVFRITYIQRYKFPLGISVFISLIFFISKTGGVITYLPFWTFMAITLVLSSLIDGKNMLKYY